MDIDYSSPVDEKDKLYKDLGGGRAFYNNAVLLVMPVRFSAVYSDASLLEACVSSITLQAGIKCWILILGSQSFHCKELYI